MYSLINWDKFYNDMVDQMNEYQKAFDNLMSPLNESKEYLTAKEKLDEIKKYMKETGKNNIWVVGDNDKWKSNDKELEDKLNNNVKFEDKKEDNVESKNEVKNESKDEVKDNKKVNVKKWEEKYPNLAKYSAILRKNKEENVDSDKDKKNDNDIVYSGYFTTTDATKIPTVTTPIVTTTTTSNVTTTDGCKDTTCCSSYNDTTTTTIKGNNTEVNEVRDAKYFRNLADKNKQALASNYDNEALVNEALGFVEMCANCGEYEFFFDSFGVYDCHDEIFCSSENSQLCMLACDIMEKSGLEKIACLGKIQNWVDRMEELGFYVFYEDDYYYVTWQ